MNIYTQQKLFDSFLGIKFTPSVPDSEFKFSRKQLILDGKLILDKNGKDTSNPMYGKTFSPESRKRMSESSSGEKNAMYGKTGAEHHSYGKKRSEETKRKLSELKSGKGNPMYGRTGTKNPMSKKAIVTWKGKEYVVDYLKEFCIKYLPEMNYGTLKGICRNGNYSKKYQVSAKYV